MLGDDHRRRLHHLDVFVGVFLDRAVLDDQHAEHLPAALDRHGEQRMIDLFAGLRPVGERRMLRGVPLVDRRGHLGAAADEAFPALQHGCMYGGRVEALARKQLQRTVLTPEIE